MTEKLQQRFNIRYFTGYGRFKFIFAIPESEMFRMAKIYCDGTEEWFYRGDRHYLELASSIHIYSIVIPEINGVDLITGSNKDVIQQLNYRVDMDIDFCASIGENITDDYILGSYGQKQYGPKLLTWLTSNMGTEPNTLTHRVNPVPSKQPLLIRNGGKRIFISHASADSDIATHFVKFFLRDGLEISINHVFYTSSHATAMDTGDDFRETIRQAMINAEVVIFLISETFKQRQYCIAEAGAAWVLGKPMIPIRIPPFDQHHAGELLGHLHYMDVNDRLALAKLRDQLVNKYKLGKIVENSAIWQEALDDFVAKADKKIAELEKGKK